MADIRTEGKPVSVNEAIRDRTIRHLVFLTRLETRESNEVLDFLENEVRPDLVDRLESRLRRIEERGFDAGTATTERVQELIDSLGEISSGGLARARRKLEQRLTEIAESEAEWQRKVVRDEAPVDVDMALPSPDQLRAAVLERPFEGQPLSRWFEGLDQNTQRSLERAVRQGIVQGETVQEIVQRVRGTRARGYKDGVLGTTTRSAEAIVRTSVKHSSAQARERTFEANRDLIKGEQWIATLDSRTCPICQDLDGRADDGEGNRIEGERELRGRRPPIHVNCRCDVVPILKSWREMGVDADDLDKSARASMNGQVPGNITYEDWLRRRVNDGDMEVVEEALGKERAKLFANGRVSVGDFVDRRGRTITLQELREREGLS